MFKAILSIAVLLISSTVWAEPNVRHGFGDNQEEKVEKGDCTGKSLKDRLRAHYEIKYEKLEFNKEWNLAMEWVCERLRLPAKFDEDRCEAAYEYARAAIDYLVEKNLRALDSNLMQEYERTVQLPPGGVDYASAPREEEYEYQRLLNLNEFKLWIRLSACGWRNRGPNTEWVPNADRSGEPGIDVCVPSTKHKRTDQLKKELSRVLATSNDRACMEARFPITFMHDG